MLTDSRNANFSKWIDALSHSSANLTGATIIGRGGDTQRADIYDDCWGQWYVVGEAMGRFAVIRCGGASEALDIFVDEFCAAEEAETEEERDLGWFTGSGKWVSEVTMSYINFVELPFVLEWKRTS